MHHCWMERIIALRSYVIRAEMLMQREWEINIYTKIKSKKKKKKSRFYFTVTLNIHFLSKRSSGQNKMQSGPAEQDTSLVINNRQPAQSISRTN